MLPQRDSELAFDFRDPASVKRWRSVDDVFMGGGSSSSLLFGEGFAVFEGMLSPVQQAGFASVRSPVAPRDWSGAEGVAMRIRGDERTYGLRLRMDGHYDGVGHSASFFAPFAWGTVCLPFHSFAPTFRGHAVSDAPALDPSLLMSFALFIADRQAGRFCLQVAWIRPYRSDELVQETAALEPGQGSSPPSAGR